LGKVGVGVSLLGFVATSRWVDVSVIVFASTAAEAKAEAITTDWLCDERWIDVRVRREPQLDSVADSYGRNALDFSTPEQVRLARNLGWYEAGRSAKGCEKCDRSEWTLLPESRLNENDICAGCEAAA
jgi:hypothetical protein